MAPAAPNPHLGFYPHSCISTCLVIFFFPYNPHPSPSRQTPPAVPPERAWFRFIWAPFGSVLGLFRVRFGSVSGVLGGVGAGSVRGAFCKVKEYHYTCLTLSSLRRCQSRWCLCHSPFKSASVRVILWKLIQRQFKSVSVTSECKCNPKGGHWSQKQYPIALLQTNSKNK